jgi:hypothetical protein
MRQKIGLLNIFKTEISLDLVDFKVVRSVFW